ncbi:MAG: tetratricopeptide repeat protein [Chloroflexota bacterium]
MLSDDQLVRDLSQHLSPGELTALLRRLLRLPEAWEALHQPGLLATLASAGELRFLVPGTVAARALGLLSLTVVDRLPEDLEAESKALWQQALDGGPSAGSLRVVALIAIGIVRALSTEGVPAVVPILLRVPDAWRVPLACAWPHLPQPVVLLQALLADEPRGLSLAAHALLANQSLEEAARSLLGAVTVDAAMLSRLVELGEPEWVQVLIRESSNPAFKSTPSPHDGNPYAHLHAGHRHLACGGNQLARQAFQQAWNAALELAATTADRVADSAEQEGDPVTALEARLQALQFGACAARRAAAALALIDMKRPEEALIRLPAEPGTFEERVALGLASLETGDRALAAERLAEAAQSRPTDIHPPWLERLAEGLHRAGRTDIAIGVSEALLSHSPAHAKRRLQHAALLFAAGHSEAAAAHASLALALEPEAWEAHHLLASALQTIGQPHLALPHWQVLAAQDVDVEIDLAQCAIQAGDLGLARQVLERMFARETPPASAHVLMAELHRAKDEPVEARAHLEKATALAPQEAEPWVALAQLQSQTGDDDGAGATLESAVQLAPHSARLQAALASRLKARGRLSEALGCIEKAVHLEPDEAEWAIERGELLRFLGRCDQAMPVLAQAMARKPGSERARLSLASCCEAVGDLTQAAHLLADLPYDVDVETHLMAGRIAARAAAVDPDLGLLARAEHHLQKALEAQPHHPEAHHWLGEVQARAGDAEGAFRSHSRAAELATGADPIFQQQVALALARSAEAAGHNELALRVLEEGRRRYPSSAAFATGLSEAYLAAGRGEQALEVARQAVHAQPDSPIALRGLARAAIAQGHWPDALHAYQRLTELRPEDTEIHLEYARAAHRAGDKDLGRSALAHALRAARGQGAAFAPIASTLQELGWPRTAQRVLQHAVNRAPQDADLVRQLALLSQSRGDFESAHRAWNRLVELRPDNVEAVARAAEASWKLDRRAAAIGLLQRAVALRPDDAALQVRLARAHRDNGDLPESLKHYALAAQRSPEDTDLALEAASAAMLQEALPEALRLLERARASAPDRDDVATALAECLVRLGRVSECRQALEPLARRGNLSARAGALLAIARAATSGIGSALEALRVALTQPTAGTEDSAWVARTALRLGQWSDGIHVLRQAAAAASPSDKAAALLELASALLHCCEVAWLLRNSEATAHVPQVDVSASEVESLLNHAARVGGSPAEIRALRGRLAHLLGTPQEDIDVAPYVVARVIGRLRNGKPEEALELPPEAIPAGAEASWVHLAIGLAREAASRRAEARAAFEQAGLDPLIRPAAMFLMGRTWQGEGQIDQAKQAYNAAVAAWPDEPAWHHRLASLYLAAGDLATALPHLQQAAELAPDDSSIALTLGRALQQDGQLSEAKAEYARALPAYPTDDVVWKEAGELALAVGDAASAESWFDRACTLSPSDARCLVGAARAAAALGKSRLAIERAQAAARLAPTDPDVLLGLGEILARQGKVEKALQAYDQALAHGQRLPVTLARARLLIQVGRAGEAALDLKHLLDHQPDSDVTWAALAEACAAARHTEEALQAAARAVRLAPRSISHRLLLSRLCRESGQLDRALKEIKEAQASSPAHPAIFAELGRIYHERRELSQALDAFQHAISLDQTSTEAHFQAGLIYKQLKAYAQAGRMFKKAVELNPKNAEAFHQLAAVNALELVHGGLVHPAVSA